jgi:two-component system response regulator MprA
MQPILVIDDDPAVREALVQALTVEGWPVVAIPDGWEAVDWMVANRPSMVLLDWRLPDFDGDLVADTLRSTYGDAVPLLLVTGQDAVAEHARAVGAFGYLRKPFDLEALYAAINKAMGDAAIRAKRSA